MSRILITGSADGLGLMAAQLLISQGHEVMLHARNQARAADAWAAAPGAAGVLAGDLSTIDLMRSVARQASESGRFDTVIHNAGVGYREPFKITTADGLSHVFAINVLARRARTGHPGTAGGPAQGPQAAGRSCSQRGSRGRSRLRCTGWRCRA
jgi:NAD(P)-dependent dehydrogenase (short-subunit alcohol dehydrogenase family)